jgi:hypothetical protein
MATLRRRFNIWDGSKFCYQLSNTKTNGFQIVPTNKEATLSATTLRVIGFLFIVAAAVVAILNLKRVANLGMMWLSPPLLIVGIAFVTLALRQKKRT